MRGSDFDEWTALVDRQLSADEVRAYLDHPITDDERNDLLALVAWFTRRYPSPAARLAYARRAYERWHRQGASVRTARRDAAVATDRAAAGPR